MNAPVVIPEDRLTDFLQRMWAAQDARGFKRRSAEEIDADRRFAWPVCGTEKFLGRDTPVSPSNQPTQRRVRPDPAYLLAPPSADAQTRTFPVPEAFAKVKRILEQHAKRRKHRQRGRNVP